MGVITEGFSSSEAQIIKNCVDEAVRVLQKGTALFGTEQWGKCFGRYFIPAEKAMLSDGRLAKPLLTSRPGWDDSYEVFIYKMMRYILAMLEQGSFITYVSSPALHSIASASQSSYLLLPLHFSRYDINQEMEKVNRVRRQHGRGSLKIAIGHQFWALPLRDFSKKVSASKVHVLIHELTHIMGSDDEMNHSLPYGPYGYTGVVGLARKGGIEPAVRNADSIAFFCMALDSGV